MDEGVNLAAHEPLPALLALPPRAAGVDVLLLSWLERHFDAATARQRAAFAALLELPDAELERFLATAEHPLQAELQVPVPGPGTEPSGRHRSNAGYHYVKSDRHGAWVS